MVKCKDCMSCTEFEYPDDSREPCCGCISMDLKYGFSDKPACTTCVANTEDGAWPNIIFSIPISTREESSYNDEVLYGNEDSAQYHHLDERVDGKATNGVKQLAICEIKNIRTRRITNYPSFPAIASYRWDGIENGK